ncbi:MAG: PAS domain S-box protein [Gemmatimonadetes bacterium]|nr:PAS domain S-box protein [Gemmatimonadota bacterium]
MSVERDSETIALTRVSQFGGALALLGILTALAWGIGESRWTEIVADGTRLMPGVALLFLAFGLAARSALLQREGVTTARYDVAGAALTFALLLQSAAWTLWQIGAPRLSLITRATDPDALLPLFYVEWQVLVPFGVIALLGLDRALYQRYGRRLLMGLGGLLAMLLLLLSGTALVSALLGAPLQWNDTTILPPASALAIALLGTSFAMRLQRTEWPRSVLVDREGKSAHLSFASTFGLVVLVFGGTVVVGFRVAYEQAAAAAQQEVRENLRVIVHARSRQVTTWLSERRGDAEIVTRAPVLANAVSALLANPRDARTRMQVTATFEAMRNAKGFTDITLFDRAGRLVLTVPASEEGLTAGDDSAIRRFSASQQTVAFEDLHRDAAGGHTHLAFYAAVGRAAGGAAEQQGVVRFQSNAAQSLFAVTHDWPFESETGEFVLGRTGPDSVEFLSDVRFDRGLAMTKKATNDPTTQLALVQMARSPGELTGRAVDYRQHAVLFAGIHVPRTPWVLLAKMDRDEVLTPVRRTFLLNLLLGLLVVVSLSYAVATQLTRGSHQALARELKLSRQIAAEAEARAASEARFGRAARATSDGIWEWNYRDASRYYSPRCEQLLGYEVGEMAAGGLRLMELIHPDDRARVQAALDAHAATDVPYAIDQRIRKKNGSYRWCHVRGELERDAEGMPLRFSGTVRDAEDQKQADLALRGALADAQRFRDALDHVPTVVFMKDTHGRYTYGNVPTLATLGVSADQLIGSDDRDYFPADAVARIQAVDEQVVRGEPATNEFESALNGESVTYLQVKTPIRVNGDSGAVTGLLGISVDITARKQQEARIRRLSEFYAAIAFANETMASSRSERELFEGICQAAVSYGKLQMAWIGVINEHTGNVVPVANVGDDNGYLQNVEISVDPHLPSGRGPTARAIRDRVPFWVQEFLHDPLTEHWLARAEKSGWKSSAALPLFRNGEAVGALTLYSSEPNVFDEEVRRLLVDMAANIGIALERFSNEKARLASEVALSISEKRLRLGLQTASTTVFNQDAQLRYVWIYHPQGLHLPSDPIVGATDAELFPADVAARITTTKQRVLQSGNAEREEFVIRRDGIVHVADMVIEPERDAGGTVIGIVGASVDVTARWDAERVLRLQGAALEAASSTILITDREGAIEWCNAAFTTTTGYTAEEALGRRTGDIANTEPQNRSAYERMWEAIREGRAWTGELVNQRKDGSLFTEDVTITPLRDDAGAITHFIAVKQDITERKSLEEQFRQSQKMESVGRLAGGVAHDFNNMLSVILGRTELALRQVEGTPKLKAGLNEIHSAALRSAELTRQLLAFARKQAVMPVVLDINVAVANSINLLKRLISEDVALDWQPSESVWPTYMDPGQVDQIMANLCVNARDAIMGHSDFAPASGFGTVMIATSNCRLDTEFCALHIDAQPGDYVRLTVRDNGCGMSSDVRARIFEPFFTTKSVGEGTGLGLATVYGAVKQSHGFILVTSAPNEGTSFDIYIPRHTGVMPRSLPQQQEEVEGGTETILLVEDEQQVLNLTKLALRELGYTVIGAGSPAEALRRSVEYQAPIHLLLTDVVMPGMNGRQLAEMLSESRPDMKILFMSGYSSQVGSGTPVLDAQAPSLAKPFTLAALALKVRSVVGSASAESER